MSNKVPVSFEFFPPRDQASQTKLINNVASKLAELGPEYFSVTYGAGGSTRDGTRETIATLLQAGFDAAPHLSMGNDDQHVITDLLDRFAEMGVKRIVALRGDQPSGFGSVQFANNARALIEVIRQHSAQQFHLTVAAYPEVHPDGKSAAADLDFFKQKVDAGADSAITQYFYNADAYEDFLERCAARNIDIPIIAGVMPINGYESIMRFSEKCGAEVPRWLRYRLAELESDNPSLVNFGIDVVSSLCERLISLGAPGLHFYTLNRWGATTRICQALNITS